MKKFSIAIILLATTFVITSCSKDDDDNYGGPSQPQLPQATIVKASGNENDLVSKIDQFRTLLGDPLNNAPGQTAGRREINWDGVPAAFTNNNTFPLDFFNLKDPAGANGRKRGLEYVNNGSPLRLDSSDFVEIDASYAAQFEAFSKKKSIISANSNAIELVFKLAGTNSDAFIRGFGVVFSDVDDANSTSMELFEGNKSLGIYKASTQTANGSFSFLGVHFATAKVSRVKLTLGNGVLAAGVKDISNGGNKDLVVMDDLFYDEPKSFQ